jgi:hypothetical protein
MARLSNLAAALCGPPLVVRIGGYLRSGARRAILRVVSEKPPIDVEFEVISGPLPSTEVIPPTPKPWWDDLFAEQDAQVESGAWASGEEIVAGVGRWIAWVAAFAFVVWFSTVVRSFNASWWPR